MNTTGFFIVEYAVSFDDPAATFLNVFVFVFIPVFNGVDGATLEFRAVA